ncbi:hypothetical protein FE257_001391 [Aspergillus nanangensis]|uniref:RING-type E3 ubiquitin transferase n=1 Tax=Aspergillus nanangensis TaxID=2582783 RepID=A0AAD4GQR2_ASPNN|nr:hypothetical protein FE257_001391 [Aspergillus nanangensis]
MSETQAPSSQAPGRGGRRRGRGGAQLSGNPDTQQQTTGGSGRGSRPRGRGSRGGGGGRDRQGRNAIKAEDTTDENLDGEQATSNPATSNGKKGKLAVTPATDDADDGEVCFICASNVEHTSVSPCNHRTCHICALRLRALYKNKACAHCRTEANYVIFTDDHSKRFEDFTSKDFSRKDENLGIEYENDEIFEDTVLLLRYNCPERDCDVACLGWPDLHRHVKSKHGRVMCDLCTRNKKVFTHEHELFTMAELRKHEKYGDDVPGAIDQSGFKGHPECGFCRQRFYGDDELYTHCRDRHERCHICDRQSASRQQQYYVDYSALEGHFQKDHFLCLDKECLDKKFVVFESQMDLKAHQLECHPNGLSKDARRDARLVDISGFDYRTPYQPQRQGRGAGRGRDPNSEPLPMSSAQPLRRDEVAYQRQMAIQSAQSVSTRSFGGQLSRNDTQPVRAPARSNRATPAQSPAIPSTPVAELESLHLSAEPASATPAEQARRLRHTTVIERASNLLGNDQNKLREFRTRVSNYRSGAISATELIDAFFSLFDTSSSELGKLIKELAEIYEDDSKRNSLLKSWNDWRAINEDYPALPGPGGILPGMAPSTVTGSGVGGKRVLRLKSSTAQSSRSAVGRSGALPSSASSSNANPFPPLSAATARSAPRNTAASATTPWGTAAAAAPKPSSSPLSLASRTSATTPSRPANVTNANAFPALPAARRPNVMMAGLTRGTVRWDSAPPASAWGSSSQGGSGDGSGSDWGESSAGGPRSAKSRYASLKILESLIPDLTNSIYDRGPFKLICDDFGPANVIVRSKDDLTITGVVDIEWVYAGPAQLFGSAPWWFLLDRPINDEWDFEDGEAPKATDRYFECLEIFTRVLAEEEAKMTGNHRKELTDLIEWSKKSGAMWLHMLLSSGFFDSPSFPCMQLRKHKGAEWWDERTDKYGDTEEVETFVAGKLKDLEEYDKVKDKVEHCTALMDSKEMTRADFICTVSSLVSSGR